MEEAGNPGSRCPGDSPWINAIEVGILEKLWEFMCILRIGPADRPSDFFFLIEV